MRMEMCAVGKCHPVRAGERSNRESAYPHVSYLLVIPDGKVWM